MNLHIGCGESRIPGWTHLDTRKLRHVDVLADARQLPFRTGMVDSVYASHLLEHFPIREGLKILKEWRRVLKKGGTLYVAVPNWDAILTAYVKGGVLSGWMKRIVYGDQTVPWGFHKNVFTEQELGSDLNRAGFRKCRRVLAFDVQPTKPDCSYLMIQEYGLPISLNMVAVK